MARVIGSRLTALCALASVSTCVLFRHTSHAMKIPAPLRDQFGIVADLLWVRLEWVRTVYQQLRFVVCGKNCADMNELPFELMCVQAIEIHIIAHRLERAEAIGHL